MDGEARQHGVSDEAPGDRTVYRDVDYPAYGLVVELDGQAGHSESADRWRDMDRDDAATLDGRRTLRFGYQLVNPADQS